METSQLVANMANRRPRHYRLNPPPLTTNINHHTCASRRGARQERKGKGVLQYVRVCILGIKYVVYVLFYLLFLWLLCLYGYACVCGHFSHLEKGIYPSF